jgi:HTH-type transcriptional regulator/antitoxin HipB
MNIKNPEQIGTAIRNRRKQLGLTQKDLALTCGAGLRFIGDLEKGKTTCRLGKMLQVLQALGFVMTLDTQESGQPVDGRL